MGERYDVVVLGSGVIGLSIALELADRGLRSAIVGRDLPEDTASLAFASPWAGCNWCSFEKDGTTPAAHWDRRTFLRLGEVAARHPGLCERVPFTSVYDRHVPGHMLWFKDLVGDVEEVRGSAEYPLPGGHPFALRFTSYLINAPGYLAHLAARAQAAGIPFVRHTLTALDEGFRLPELGEVRVVVNATSLGARTLAGVEDGKVWPARGQTVLVRAPGVRRCIMQTEGFGVNGAPLAYVIPRPGTEHVVLGGTYFHSPSSAPDPVEAERILRACYALAPELATTASGWEGIEVVRHQVGLRPAREGGARVELEKREAGGCVHAYGFGGAGYQASLGVAERVAELVEEYLAEKK